MAEESIFQKKVKKALRRKYTEKQLWFFKHHATFYSVSGIPDVIGSLFGFFFAVELKAKGKKASTLQKIKVMKIKWTGGMALVSDDLDEIMNYLEVECEKRLRQFNKV